MSQGTRRPLAASALWLAAASSALLLCAAPRSAAASVPDQPCPARPSSAPGASYAGKQLAYPNFSRQNLTNADFSGAVLTGASFLYANLTGANFSGATIKTDRLPTDFAFANLTSACFKNVKFQGPTYFTYAALTCTDFSSTDLSANVVFGDSPLRFNPGPCRTAFRNATLNCEFFAQWNALDLSGAVISACNSLIKPGHDFSGARLAGVTFDGLDLSGSKWAGAVVTGASFQGSKLDNATGLAGTQGNPSLLALTFFNGASLKNVDLSYAQLYGANLTYANLENANLQGAFLTSNTKANPPINSPAVLTGAHLKNVNLANAQLGGAVMNYVSFYGGGATFRTPPATCSTDVSNCASAPVTGGTCSCATAAGADLTATNFSNAFLYGVDFSGKSTNVNGTNFSGAILVSANFSGATWSVDPQKQGAPPLLSNAYLQGVDLHDANLTGAVLTGAYVDFGAATNPSNGNVIALKLAADYAKFRGWPPSPGGVCVQVNYGGAPPAGHFSLLPTATRMTCPDGRQYPGGCGPLAASTAAWQSGTPLASAASPGYYVNDASFDSADPRNPACNIGIRNRDW